MSLQKLGALLFLLGIALIPVVIVIWGSERGGIFVAGYVIGVITAPMVALGVIRAVAVLADSTWTGGLFGFLIFAVVVLLVSVSAALWSFLFM